MKKYPVPVHHPDWASHGSIHVPCMDRWMEVSWEQTYDGETPEAPVFVAEDVTSEVLGQHPLYLYTFEPDFVTCENCRDGTRES